MQEKPGSNSIPPLKGIPGISWWWIVSGLAVGLVVGYGSLQLVSLIARPIALFLLGIAIAFALAPVISYLERRMPRVWAVVIVFLSITLIFTSLGWLIFPAMWSQFREIGISLPRVIDRIQFFLENNGSIIGQGAITSSMLSQLGSFAGTLLRAPVVLISFLLDFLLIIFVAIYWLLLMHSFNRFLLSLCPAAKRPSLQKTFRRMGMAMGGYIRGVAINGLIMGALVFIGMSIIGVKYPVALGVLTAMLEMIPVLGPIIAGAIIVITALMQSPTLALIAGIYMLVMQQLEGHLLVPNIIRSQTNTSSLLILLALFAGNYIGGLVGGLAAVPLISAFQVIVVDWIAPLIRHWSGADIPEVENKPAETPAES